MEQMMVNPAMKKHVDDEGKVRCELVHPVTADDFGKIVFSNKHMHAWISHNRVEENYVDVKFDEEPLTGDEWLHMMQHK